MIEFLKDIDYITISNTIYIHFGLTFTKMNLTNISLSSKNPITIISFLDGCKEIEFFYKHLMPAVKVSFYKNEFNQCLTEILYSK